MPSGPLLTVTWYALATAVATGLGALPFFFVKHINRVWLGICSALAAGLMLGASGELVWKGWSLDWIDVVIGIAAGLGFILLGDKLLARQNFSIEDAAIKGADLAKMVRIVGILTIHSFAEGVSIGVSFGDSLAFGLLIALTLAVHNIPEGLAISLVLCPKGVPAWKAALWSIFSSLPQPLMAVPAFIFVNTFEPFLPFGLGFAAGAMVWVVLKDLLPEASREAGVPVVSGVVALSAIGMLALGLLFT